MADVTREVRRIEEGARPWPAGHQHIDRLRRRGWSFTVKLPDALGPGSVTAPIAARSVHRSLRDAGDDARIWIAVEPGAGERTVTILA